MTGMFCMALLEIEEPESEARVSLLADWCMLFCGLRLFLRGDCLPGALALVVLGGRSGIATSPPLPCLAAKLLLLDALEGISSNC